MYVATRVLTECTHVWKVKILRVCSMILEMTGCGSSRGWLMGKASERAKTAHGPLGCALVWAAAHARQPELAAPKTALGP